ncbi:class A beta-lactamase [Erythrobacter crassostreae]|uniref:beta-lactamase n=1 Tax=Erythrobacter crassostreae TaxID=2828328 RepID=A0A9X1F3I7_9SPHN|nr:class A beta-lactamase [Erythrobacter crassostrea]MBV7258155.1 class A beta-lactamase [Erythrobacter crassostrea]
MIRRRTFLGGSIALGASACLPIDQSPLGRLTAKLRIIEAAADGTLGAEIYDTATGSSVGLNRDARFGHCSSFKLSLAAIVLARDAAKLDSVDRRVTWTQADLMSVSPFTTRRLAEGATLGELAEAAQKYSDNAAANILLREIGGPAELTGFWRSIGDETSRLDRIEPSLNNVPAGELRDTSTPAAMARTIAKLIYGDALPEARRSMLRQWMIDTSTGARRVRADLPDAWPAGDKTGTSIWPGMGSLYVDIGFVEPDGHLPITFAAYFRAQKTHDGIDPASEEVLARVGEVVADFARRDRILPLLSQFVT